MHCIQCGSLLSSGATFCQRCGAPVAPQPMAGPQPPLGYATSRTVGLPVFRPGGGLVTALYILFGIMIAVLLASVPIRYSVIQHIQVNGYSQTELSDPEGLEACAALLYLGLFVATAVVFLVWFYRVAKNLRALGADEPRFSPGWCVGYWFIPFANLFRPYQAAKDIWARSEPPGSEGAGAGGALLGGWWAMWIISAIVGNLAARVSFRADEAQAVINTAWIMIVSDLLDAIAAVLAVLVIRGIHDRQTRRFAALNPDGPLTGGPLMPRPL